MGIFFYNVIVRIYNFLLLISSFFNRKARLIVLGRNKTFSILEKLRKPDEKIIWFHCASLGEFEQGRPVMESIREKWTGYKIYVSFFSSSGYEIRKNDVLLDAAFYLPADTRENAEKLISLIKPKIAIFVKYEFWYHFFEVCNRYRIPLVSISTILRPDQVFFNFYGKFYRDILKKVDAYFVQDELTRQLLQKIGVSQIEIAGDTRFDRVLKIRSIRSSNPVIEQFTEGRPLIILGSTWKPDIDLWKSYTEQNPERYKYLIAPHHIDEGNLRYIERRLSLPSLRYTNLRGEELLSFDVLIMDQIGLLSSLYYYGYINYVGGAFSEGLHNLLEPAVFGAPILFGKDKSNKKYLEAVGLIEAGGAFEVGDPDDLVLRMDELSEGSSLYQEACEKTLTFVDSRAGATEKIVASLKSIISGDYGRIGH
jgi:3-deoxy-D-manno-octulosonic-acid transferase